MAFHLLGTRPLPETDIFSTGPLEIYSHEIWIKAHYFSRKCIWKCPPQHFNHYVQVSMWCCNYNISWVIMWGAISVTNTKRLLTKFLAECLVAFSVGNANPLFLASPRHEQHRHRRNRKNGSCFLWGRISTTWVTSRVDKWKEIWMYLFFS